MKDNVPLAAASLLTILFATLHLAHDIVRGMSPGGLLNLLAVVMIVIWLYGTVILAAQPAGYLIVVVFSLLSLVIPILHLQGPGVGYGTHRSDGLFFVWTILAIGVTALFSVIVSARALWKRPWRESGSSGKA